jgi:type VI protein secretion system component Hcp
MIRSIFISCFLLGTLLAPQAAYSQSAVITQDAMDEADIRDGGKRIFIDLEDAHFDGFSDEIRRDIIDGLSGGTSFDLVKAGIPLEDVDRLSNTRTRITLPATPGYFINSDEYVSVEVPASALYHISSPIAASPDVQISNLSSTLSFSGSLLSSVSETDIRNGGSTLIITAGYNLWRPELRTTQLALIRNLFSSGAFRDQAASVITSTNVSIDKNVLTVTMPAAPNYFIGSKETVTVTVTDSYFTLPETLSNAIKTFDISNENPLVTLQNVVFGEEEIRSGNRSFTITMSGDKFINPLNVSELRNDFSGGTGWESNLENTLTFIRNNDFQVVATIPRLPGFDIDVPEQVSLSLGHENIEYTTSSSFADPVNRISLVPLVPHLTILSVPSPLNEDNLNGSILKATLTETRLKDLTLLASDLQIIPAITGLVINNPVNITTNYFEVPLSFSGDLEDDASIALVLDGDQTLYGSDLTSNTLSLSSAYEPQVTSVSIPNVPMGTGDVVTVTITFTSNSEPGIFSYVGGTIEGEPLVADSVKKINNTTYTTVFTIQEDTPNRRADQSVRVRDLQFSNGINKGIPVNYDIVQNNDEIDTDAPVISYIRYADGVVYNIGKPVVGNVVTDGADYEFDNSRSYINGVSFSYDRIQVENKHDNTYTVTYVPMEGDKDVSASEKIKVELVMIDRVGNRNSPPVSTLYMGYSPVIDANSPALDSAVVANPGIKGIGDQVEILLYATEILKVPDPPLEGTHVNFVPISSSNVVFEHVSGRVYRLLYTVAIGDNGVNPGQLTYNLVMEDVAGNRSNSNVPLKNNNVTIGSDIPTAAIIGGNSVCIGDSLRAYLHFTGSGPWDAVVSNSKGVYMTVTRVNSPYAFWIKTTENESFFVSSVKDKVGNAGITYGQLDVTVNFPTPVEILLDRTTFLSSEPGVKLRADHEPGVFSGKGVSSGYFYPSIATPVGSPHTITYAYQNQLGCVSHAYADIEVVEGSGSVHLLSGTDTINVLCNGQGTYEIRGANKEGKAGLFELRITNSATVVPGHIVDGDSTDNTAILDATGLSGGYDIIYRYVIDAVTLTASNFLLIDEIGALEITSNLPSRVCKNDPPYLLTGNLDGIDPLATCAFSGPGVSGDQAYGFFYDPSSPDAPVGDNQITYSYSSSSGCLASISANVINSFVPAVMFSPSTVCLAEGGETVQFHNETSGKFAVAEWQWNFGDIGSGIYNYSDQEEPEHFYGEPGVRSILLKAITTEGCVAGYRLDTLFADKPVADFTWINDCFVTGKDVLFVNHSKAGFSALDTFSWVFKTPTGAVLGGFGSSPGEDTVSYPFRVLGNYIIELHATNTGGCEDKVSKELKLTPTVMLTYKGYKEPFNESEGNWSVHSSDGVESWRWDVPNFDGFEPNPGDKAWFTDLPYGIVGYDESSWVQSPCLDFSKMKRPMVQVDIMKSFVPNLTGSVLQYQDVIKEGWKTVGLYEEGINWYNSNTIFKNPGGSKYGWGLNLFEPDTDWVTAKHDLDMIAGKPRIKLRFVIGTNGKQGIGNQGFAFDNLLIAERTRYSLLEHFTNSGDMSSRAADTYVDSLAMGNRHDMIDLQYHTDYPGFDMMNENNPDPPDQRFSFYNIPQVPYSVLNGGTSMACRYDFSDLNNSPDAEALYLNSLEIPAFKIGMDVEWLDNSFDAEIVTTCQAERYTNNIQLYTAVIESYVTAYIGENQDTMFRNVVLDMLPYPSGMLLGGNWVQGQSVSKSFSWDYKDYVEDIEELALVAFVLDRENRRVLQALISYHTNPVGTRERVRPGVSGMTLFPNPATDFFYVNLGEEEVRSGELMMMDMSGRILAIHEVHPGFKIQRVEIPDLPQGIYMVCWFESGQLKARNKLIRTR